MLSFGAISVDLVNNLQSSDLSFNMDGTCMKAVELFVAAPDDNGEKEVEDKVRSKQESCFLIQVSCDWF